MKIKAKTRLFVPIQTGALCLVLSLALSACGSTLWPSEDEAPYTLEPNQTGRMTGPAPQNGADGQMTQTQVNQAIESLIGGNLDGNDGLGAPASLRPMPPLITIDFQTADTRFQQNLFAATSRLLDIRPAARFQILVISPSAAKAEQQQSIAYGLKVRQSLVDMGISPVRIRMLNAIAPFDRPQIFVYSY